MQSIGTHRSTWRGGPLFKIGLKKDGAINETLSIQIDSVLATDEFRSGDAVVLLGYFSVGYNYYFESSIVRVQRKEAYKKKDISVISSKSVLHPKRLGRGNVIYNKATHFFIQAIRLLSTQPGILAKILNNLLKYLILH